MQGPKAYSPSQLELESELDDDSDLDELLTCFPSPPPRRPPLYQLVPPTLVGHASMTSLDGLPEIALPHSPLNTRELSEVVLPPSTGASSTSPNALQWETHSSSDGRRGTEIAYLEATRMQTSLRKATPPSQRPSGSSKPAEALSVGRDGGHKTQEKNAAGEARRKRTFGMSHGFRARRHPSTDKVDEHGWLAGRPIETERGPFSRPDPTPSSLLPGRSSSFGPRSSSLSPPKKKRDARHLRFRNKSIDQFAQAGADNGNEFFDVAQRSLIDVHHSDHGDDLAAPLRKLSLSDAETTGENQPRFRQVQVPSLSISYALVRLLRAAAPTLNLDDSQTRLLYTRELPEVPVDALKLRGDAAKAAAAKKFQL
ncbi:hypothetical protein JCM1840_000103 [Sporobolomyces johnsonii]